jgi:integrase
MKAFSPGEAERFLEVVEKDRWATLWDVAISTGMRPGKYLASEWTDVDLKAGNLTVRRALVRRKDGRWEFDEPKTPQSRRKIPLPPSVVASLATHEREQAEERLTQGPEYNNQDLVFATSTGAPLNQINLSRRHFKPILRDAGLSKEFRMYDLQHTCAHVAPGRGRDS